MQTDLSVLAIIPARMASTRFYGKPLTEIAGKPMIERVYERAQAAAFSDIIVATDSDEILQCVESFGGRAMMTRSDHTTGLDRIIEVFSNEPGYEIYLNIQGDEPLVEPQTLQAVIENFRLYDDADISTAAYPFDNYEDSLDPNQVKVVIDASGKALYFSRSQIPHHREPTAFKKGSLLKHQGIYAYSNSGLKKIQTLAATELENLEKLEQLRFLYHGLAIYVAISQKDSIGVDTPEDVKKVEAILNG